MQTQTNTNSQFVVGSSLLLDMGMAELSQTGTVIVFDPTRNFGFIQPDIQYDSICVRLSALEGDLLALRPGDRVEFDVVRDGQGVRAVNVRKLRISERNKLAN